MANSMTGFGRYTASECGRELTIELKSVNHRYLDPAIRMPRQLGFLEDGVRSQLSTLISRGHIEIYISYENDREDARVVQLDRHLLSAYADAAKQASDIAEYDLKISDFLHVPDVFKIVEAEEDQAALIELCKDALAGAAAEMIKMRRAEGKRLSDDLTARAGTLRALVGSIAQREPLVVAEYKDKLEARINELLGSNAPIDQQRLAAEVAIFADKASITEELVRLGSHLTQLGELLSSDEPVGRKLDFMVQEMNREVNTIGSKASDLQILGYVIEAKAIIEKIREQVQNIE